MKTKQSQIEWKEIELGDICKVKGGYAFKSLEFTDGGIPIVRISNFNDSYVDLSRSVYYPNNSLEKFKEFILEKGDLLIAMSGATTGKIGIYNYEDLALLNQRVGKFEILNPKILLKKYLLYFIKSSNFKKTVFETAFGVAQPNISSKKIESIKIFLPFLDEKPHLETQKEIVAILEKADQLKEKRKIALELLDGYLKSVFSEMFGNPIKNNKKWPLKKLIEFGEWQSGGTPLRSKPEYFNGDIDWYSSGELNNMFILESIEKINESAIIESAAKLIQKNSLLLGMYDTAALKSSITIKECSCNQAIAFSQLEKRNVNILYLYFVIQIGKSFYMSGQRGVRQKNLNLSMIKNLQIPLPPLTLQKKFASIVEQVEKLKEKQKKSYVEIETLFDSLMQKAFKGELIK